MMPLHRRHPTASRDDKEFSEIPRIDPDDRFDPSRSRSASATRKNRFLIRPWHKILLIALVQAVVIRNPIQTWMRQRDSKSLCLMFTSFIATSPFSMALAVGLGAVGGSRLLPHQHYIPLSFLASTASKQIPSVLSCAFVCIGILWFGLASRPIREVGDDQPPKVSGGEHKGKTNSTARPGMSEPVKLLLSVFLLISVLLTENFLIWVVSATYRRSQDRSNLPEPLQDNGQIFLRYLFGTVLGMSKRTVVMIRNTVDVQWALVTGLGLSFVATELQGHTIGRQMWPLARRAVCTLAMARTVRSISFLITVLPSQNQFCYFQHFPTPPDDWLSWLMVGFTPQSHGGCNDLIISGHATVTATVACIIVSLVDHNLFSLAVSMLLGMDYACEIFEGFHYSVDMFLGAVLVSLVWTVLAPIEENAYIPNESGNRFKTMDSLTVRELLRYALPPAGAFVQVSGIIIPKSEANYTIMVYIFAAIAITAKHGILQYTQHTLFCLLYIALGSYL